MTDADVYRLAAEIVDESPYESTLKFACNAIFYAQRNRMDDWAVVWADPLVYRFRHSILRPDEDISVWWEHHERPECPVIALLFMAEIEEA